jgi:hypothetical protein
MSRSVIELTSGTAGSGKTFERCARFVVKYLMNPDAIHISNFPIKPMEVAQEVAKRLAVEVESVLARIEVIPEEVLRVWAAGKSGPWEYFKERDLNHCHIAIDEAHRYCGTNSNGKIKAKWEEWLGYIRHHGATVEFLSQHVRKLAREIINAAEIRRVLTSSENRRDPLFSILMADWYELDAAVKGNYVARVWVSEKRQVNEKWVVQHQESFKIDPALFRFYDSFSVEEDKASRGYTAGEHIYTKGLRHTVVWFVKKNAWQVFWRLCLFFFGCYMCFGGGIQHGLRAFTEFNKWVASRASIQVQQESKPKAPVSSLSSTTPGTAAKDNLPSKLASGITKTIKPDEIDIEPETCLIAHANIIRLTGKPGEPVLVWKRSLITDEGEVVHIGDTFQSGCFKGKGITGIDLAGRHIFLTGHVIIDIAVCSVSRTLAPT